MKSLFLLGITGCEADVESALRSLLPGQERPWLLQSPASGDSIAYFNLGTELEGESNMHIQADISGRHFGCDAQVIEVLRSLQRSVGGVIANDA